MKLLDQREGDLGVTTKREWGIVPGYRSVGLVFLYFIFNFNFKLAFFVTTQVPKTTIGGLHYAGTTRDVGNTVTKPGI